MATLPVVFVCTAAAKDDINAVLEAQGRGPGTISRPATTVANPAWDATPTHYYASDASATDSLVAIWQGFAAGDLPPVPDGTVWGQNGVISAEDAMAAIVGANLRVYTVSGDIEPAAHGAAALATEGLYIIPDPPL